MLKILYKQVERVQGYIVVAVQGCSKAVLNTCFIYNNNKCTTIYNTYIHMNVL